LQRSLFRFLGLDNLLVLEELEGFLQWDKFIGRQHLLNGEVNSDLSHGYISDLAVDHNALEDGLAGGTTTHHQGLDGCSDHDGVGRVADFLARAAAVSAMVIVMMP